MAIVSASWNTGSGDWFASGNWDEPNPNPPPNLLHYVPGAGNDVSIQNNATDGSTLTVSYNGTDTVNTLNSIGAVTLNLSGGSLAILNSSFFNEIDVALGASLAIGGTLSLSQATIAGTVSGDTLRFINGTFNINSGADITASTWLLDYEVGAVNTSTTVLNTDLTYGGNFILQSPYGDVPTLELNGHELTLAGTSSLNGNIDGSGTLKNTGSTTIFSSNVGYDPAAGYAAANALTFDNAGTVTQTDNIILNGTIENDAGATWDITAGSITNGSDANVFANNGLLERTGTDTGTSTIDAAFSSSGMVDVETGTIYVSGGGGDLSGSIKGSGTFIIGGGGNYTFEAGLQTSVDNLSIFDSSTVTLDEDAVYSGTFNLSNGYYDDSTLDLNGHTYELGGISNLGGTVDGGGTLKISGTSTLNEFLTVGGSSVLEDAGTIDNYYALKLGSSANDTAELLIDSGATYNLTGNNIYDGSNGSTLIDNKGTFANTSIYQFTVAPQFVSSGTIDVGSGGITLSGGSTSLGGTVKGSGNLYLYNSTFDTSDATTYDIASGFDPTMGSWTIGSVTASFAADVSYGGYFYTFGDLELNGHTLTLSGTSQASDLDGSASGKGTILVTGSANVDDFTLDGSVVLEDAGNITNVQYLTLGAQVGDTAELLIDAGATYTMQADNDAAIIDGTENVFGPGTTQVVNKGTLAVTNASGAPYDYASISPELSNYGAITIAAGGILSLSGGSTHFGGTVSGAGTLEMNAGSFALDADFAISTAGWTLYSGYYNATDGITLSADLSYGGTFTDYATINLSSYTLTLSGATQLGDAINGPGLVLATGTGDINGLTLSQGASLDISGSYTESGDLTFGDDTSELSITDTGSLTVGGSNSYINIASLSEGDISLSNAGSLDVEGYYAGVNTSILNSGTITVGAQLANFNGSTLANDGTISVLSGGTLDVYGDVAADSGKSGTFDIADHATLSFLGSVASDQTIDFAATGSGTLIFTPDYTGGVGGSPPPIPPAAAIARFASIDSDTIDTYTPPPPAGTFYEAEDFNAAIDNFRSDDTIEVANFSATSATFENGFYTLSDGTRLVTFNFGDDQTASDLSFYTDSNGDTFVETTETPCYCPGTMIATDHGEIAVEDLVIGDHVLAVSGRIRPIKWIGRRDYSGRFILGRKDILPICIEAGALAPNVPARDLWVSPHHALYIDGLLVEAKDLLNDVSIYQADMAEEVTYFHIELDSHDVILADGAWAESYIDDDSRGMFHNAWDYAARYPNETPAEPLYCAPRVEDGPALEKIRERLSARGKSLRDQAA